MATLKLAPNPTLPNISINNQPDPRAINVPGGPPVTQWGQNLPRLPAGYTYHTWSTPGPNLHPLSTNLPWYAKPGATIALGAMRSLEGTGQAASGLYDLVSPGKGTNRFSKTLDTIAKGTDVKAAQYGVKGPGYSASQLAADLLLAKGANFGLKTAAAGTKAAKVIYSGTRGAKLARYTAANVGANAFYTGQQASRGTKISSKNVATGLAIGEALPVAGVAARKVPAATRFLHQVVLPNKGNSAFYDQMTQHLINSGAVKAARTAANDQAVQAGISRLGKTEAAIKYGKDLTQATQTKALPPGTRFVINSNHPLVEPMAKLASAYQAQRGKLERLFKNRPQHLQTAIANLDAKFATRRDAIMSAYSGAGETVAAKAPKAGAVGKNVGKTTTVKAAGVDTGLSTNATLDEIKAEYQRFIDDMPGTKYYKMTPKQRTVYGNKLRQMAEKAKSAPPPVEKPVAQTAAKAEKQAVAQSVPTEVKPPAEAPVVPAEGAPPADLTNPSKGNMAKTESSLRRHIGQGGYLTQDQRKALTALYHPVQNQAKMRLAAERLVAQDKAYAETLLHDPQLPDGAKVKIGHALGLQAAREGNVQEINRLIAETSKVTTGGSQAMRAARIENVMSPRGLQALAIKVADMQGRKLGRTDLAQLEEMATRIEKMQDGPAKTEMLNAMYELAQNRNLWTKGVDYGFGIISLPRAIMASTDLSFGLRQGAVLGSRFPVILATAQAKAARMAVDTNYFREEMGKLANLRDVNGVNYLPVFKRMGIDLEAVWGRSEEIFGTTSIAESKAFKKVGAGHIIAGSDRAFSGAAAYMRATIAKKIIDGLGGIDAIEKEWTTRDFKNLGRVINTGTGRGHGGMGLTGQGFEKIAPALGKTLFSARLWKSRLDLLNPLYYHEVWSTPAARKLALQSAASFSATVGIALAAAAAVGATVETDLRSSDFGKIKVGNTRFDIMGGLQQNLVLFWREAVGQYKSSTTGNVSDLAHPKFGGANRMTIIGRTVENKLAPALNQIITQITGTDISGKAMTGTDRLKSVGSLFVPLNVQDTYSTAKDKLQSGGGAKGAVLGALEAAVPGSLGVGVQTYSASGPPKANAGRPGTTIGNNVVNKPANAPLAPADAAKLYFGNTKVNYQGQQVKWTDLNSQQQSQLAQTDPKAYDYLQVMKSISKAFGGNKLYSPQLDPTSRNTLNYFDHLSTAGKAKVLLHEPSAQYKLDLAAFNNDKLLGKFTDAAMLAKAQKTLAKAKVGADYAKPIRDSYSMTKTDLEKFLGQGNNRSMFNQLIAYDDALYNAGLISSHKFRNKYGTITLGIGGSGSSGSGGSGGSSRSSSRSGGSSRARKISLTKYQTRPKGMRTSTRTSLSKGPGSSIAVRRPSHATIRVTTKKAQA